MHSNRTLVLSSTISLFVLAVGCASSPSPSSSTGASVDIGLGDNLDAAPLLGTVSIAVAGARDIAPYAFGQNYWNWEPTWGAAVVGTEAQVKAAGVKLIRSGGANNETQTPNVFDNSQLDKFVAYCKSVGAEPVVQVSLITNAALQPATAQDAADMVTYANVTMGYGVKYWSIGNEPDLYNAVTPLLKPLTYGAADYCASFKEYASAMRAVDPTIKIIGPELSWKYQAGTNDWLTPFLDGCKDVVDIVSVHRYPFPPAAATKESAFADATRYRQVLKSLRANLDSHGMQTTPLAITEEHVTYDGTPALSIQTASPQTFFASMWAADALGVGLEEGLWTSAFWHIADSASGWYLAFILGGTPKPTYYATSLVANNLAGKMLVTSGVPAGFSVYASRDDGAAQSVVMVLNKTQTAGRLSLVFDTLPGQNLGFPSESLTVVVIADGSAAPQIFRYTKNLADAGLPPVQEQ